MTFRLLAVALSLLVAGAGAPTSAPAQDTSPDGSFKVAQKVPDGAEDDQGKGKGKGKNGKNNKDGKNKGKGKDKDAKAAGNKPGKKADAPKDDGAKKNQQAKDKSKVKANDKQKKDAKTAPQNVIERKQALDAKAKKAKEADRVIKTAPMTVIERKALQAKENNKALKQKQQDAEDAKKRAIKRNQLEAVQQKSKSKPPKYDRAKADQEFEKAREQAKGDRGTWRAGSAGKFETLRKGRKERVDFGGARNVIIEPDKRVIVRQNNRSFIRHDESDRLRKRGREVRRERRKDGTILSVVMGVAGVLIYTLEDDQGRLLRRSRKGRDGREIVLIDNRRFYHGHASSFGPDRYYDTYVDLPPPVVRIPRNKYIVEYDDASVDDIYDALIAPPVEDLDRGYSLDEIRHSYGVLERMRRVDLNSISFEFASWDVGEDQYRKLERIADAMRRIIEGAPEEVFLIEGHTDAVGSDVDNLSLSDRRAETVAIILSETFGIPAENLTTQGYGEQYLKEPTDGPSLINRRVSLRRITPLLSKEGWNDAY